MAWTCDVSIEEKVRQDCYNRGYEQGRKNPCEEIVEHIEKLQNQLKEYQDKIEQGKMIELPCKVGDKVYLVHRDKLIIECWIVTQFSVEEAGLWLHIRNEKLLSAVIHSKSRGVCFTREEAEKRLRKLQGDKE